MLHTIHEPAHILLGQYSISDLSATCASEDTDITEHIANLTNICHTLIQNQQYTSDADFKNILLNSVPCSWEPFISALNAQDSTKKMTVNQLKTTIMEEYLRQKRRNATGDTAYTTSSSLSYPKKKKCAICKCMDHVTDRCRWKDKNAPNLQHL